MEEKKKNNTGLIVAIIVLLMALTGIGTYILCDKVLMKDKEYGQINNTVNNTINNSTAENIPMISLDEAQRLVARYHNYYFDQTIIKTNKQKLDINAIPEDDLMRLVFEYADKNHDAVTNGLSGNDFDEAKKELFGNNVNLTKKTFTHYCDMKYVYSNNHFTYDGTGRSCGVGDTFPRIKAINITRDGTDRLNVEVLTAYYTHEAGSSGIYTGKWSSEFEAIDPIGNGENYELTNVEKNIYNFSYDEPNANYYLNSINHINK